MLVNSDKNEVVHFRNSRKPVTLFQFSYGEMDLEKKYNYLGVKFTKIFILETVLKHTLMLLLRLSVELCASVNNPLMWDILTFAYFF